ncbi:hypothetical protein K0M31_001265 [Melipona bicolor]|uniref:Uncharacterized protein n=1 Tax=Melipona bicolor TaxID=60889 RepID=A0AA40GF64_9HYME|nr:hypothetical protein K0M31_001265 [Melipona bicolor]
MVAKLHCHMENNGVLILRLVEMMECTLHSLKAMTTLTILILTRTTVATLLCHMTTKRELLLCLMGMMVYTPHSLRL